MRMLAYAFAIVLGLAGGLRTFVPLFAVRFPYRDWTTVVSGLLLAGELIADKIPGVPARTSPGPLIGRIVVSGYAGWALAVPMGANGWLAALCGAVGAVAGARLGYDWRVRIAPRIWHLPDVPAALLEDVVAVGGALWLVLANRSSP